MNSGFNLRAKISEFWQRPYRADVALLDHALATRNETSARLEPVPPSILTGNPYNLQPGKCIAVVGLNPKWRGYTQEIQISEEEHRRRDFTAYERRRLNYFNPNSPEFYGGHFTKLQNRLSETLIRAEPASVFVAHAFIVDLLPWWSNDTKYIDQQKATLAIEPLRAWKSVLNAFLAELQPAMIVMNGCGMRDLTEVLLEVRLASFVFEDGGKESTAYCGHRHGVPVLAHRQLSAPGSPGKQAYASMVSAWRHLIR